MIRPKRITKKKKIINALYIDYKDLYNLAPNSCVNVNKTYFYMLANMQKHSC